MLVFQAAYRRAEVERTVVLSRSPFEIVVCKDKVGETENEEGYKEAFLRGVPLYQNLSSMVY